MPATKPEWFAKAASGPSDAIIIDLEDAVPLDAKDAARDNVRSWLDKDEERDTEKEETAQETAQIWIRLNREHLTADLAAVVDPKVHGYIVAKCDLEALDVVEHELARLETNHRVSPEASSVVGLIEDAAALTDLPRICSHPRLTALGLGEVDLLADLRIERAPDTEDLVDSIRGQIVIHSAAAKLRAPVAPTSTDFRDLEEFRTTSMHLARMGFRARTAIHPGQVAVINEVLTPSDDEIARAEAVLDRFNAAAGGIYVDATGTMVDAAVVRAATETLERRR